MRKHKCRYKKPALISNWKDSWKMSCVQAAAVLAVLNVINAEILPLFHFTIPATWMNWLNALLGVAIIVLRLILQPPLAVGPEKREPPL